MYHHLITQWCALWLLSALNDTVSRAVACFRTYSHCGVRCGIFQHLITLWRALWLLSALSDNVARAVVCYST